MTDFQAGFLSLIRSALTEAPPVLPGDFDFGRAYALAERHQVLPLIYYGAMCDPDFMSHPMAESFFQRTCAYISYSARQQETVEELCRLLDRTGVDYMPLKGSVLKALYPRPEMRIMGDADILIHMEDLMYSFSCCKILLSPLTEQIIIQPQNSISVLKILCI